MTHTQSQLVYSNLSTRIATRGILPAAPSRDSLSLTSALDMMDIAIHKVARALPSTVITVCTDEDLEECYGQASNLGPIDLIGCGFHGYQAWGFWVRDSIGTMPTFQAWGFGAFVGVWGGPCGWGI